MEKEVRIEQVTFNRIGKVPIGKEIKEKERQTVIKQIEEIQEVIARIKNKYIIDQLKSNQATINTTEDFIEFVTNL